MKEKESCHLAKDPLDDSTVCAKFVSEVEKYEKLVDGLVRKSLNGTTPLDQKWKVILNNFICLAIFMNFKCFFFNIKENKMKKSQWLEKKKLSF